MKNLKTSASILLTIAIILAIIPAVPLTVAADTSALKSTIESFEGGGLIATVDGDTVTVTGAITTAFDTLTLPIPTDVKVVWMAELSGAVPRLINIAGDGTFEVADGEITGGSSNNAIYTESANIVVSGGVVSALPSSGVAINNVNGTITVSDGVVKGGLTAFNKAPTVTGNYFWSNSVSGDSPGTVSAAATPVSDWGDVKWLAVGDHIWTESAPTNLQNGDVVVILNTLISPAAFNVPQNVEITIGGETQNVLSRYSLNIPDNSKVVWKAKLSSLSNLNRTVEVGGNGTFEVAGGWIRNTATGGYAIVSSVDVTQSGGIVSASGSGGFGIHFDTGGKSFTISGGIISGMGRSISGAGTTTIIGGYEWSLSSSGTPSQIGGGPNNWDNVRWLKVTPPYTVTFDTLGGTPVEELLVADGDTITEPTEPTKDGFAFGGWFTDTDFTDEWDFDVNVVTKNITLYAKWLDTTDPTGEITIETNKFTTFLNTITFGLLFKNTVDVTITGDDEGSGVASIEYFLSETALPAETDWDNVDWTTGDFTTVNANWKGVAYARITDNAGNSTVISSNGMIVCDCDVAPQTDCTIAVDCDFCGEEVFPVKPHVYEPQTDLTKAVYCDDCDFKVRDELPTIEVDVVNGKVEIRNNANVFFSTKGYYLTDGTNKWALPAMLVRSRSAVVIGGGKRDRIDLSGVEEVWLVK